MADFFGVARNGDLFGCPACGSLQIHGITDTDKLEDVNETNKKYILGTVNEFDLIFKDENGYVVYTGVKLTITEDFLLFMRKWNLSFINRFSANFPYFKTSSCSMSCGGECHADCDED
jgi:hypothetical protein